MYVNWLLKKSFNDYRRLQFRLTYTSGSLDWTKAFWDFLSIFVLLIACTEKEMAPKETKAKERMTSQPNVSISGNKMTKTNLIVFIREFRPLCIWKQIHTYKFTYLDFVPETNRQYYYDFKTIPICCRNYFGFFLFVWIRIECFTTKSLKSLTSFIDPLPELRW